MIVPTYDRPAMLRQALQSIRDVEADGDDPSLEIIVGDHGHKPETKKTCADFDAIHALAEGRGASVGRNAAFKVAGGDFIAFLDDDDVWLKSHLRPHLAFLDANPNFDAVFGQASYADPDLNPYGPPWPKQPPGEGDVLLRAMLGGFFPQIGTVVARRSAIETYGPFDVVVDGGEDWDWQLRIASAHKLGHVSVPSILFRGRPKGSYDAMQRNRIGVGQRIFLRHALAQRRIWRSPHDLMRGYHDTLHHFYAYFLEKARRDVAQNHRWEAVKVLGTLFASLPLLVLADLTRPSELRSVAGEIVRGPSGEKES